MRKPIPLVLRDIPYGTEEFLADNYPGRFFPTTPVEIISVERMPLDCNKVIKYRFTGTRNALLITKHYDDPLSMDDTCSDLYVKSISKEVVDDYFPC
ncbi:hypothetical protein J6T21_03660 [Candidatus Saccharibacteria bacterium]|nr:hypothetical protein [Candidatus Saccharibacteria bacterium]